MLIQILFGSETFGQKLFLCLMFVFAVLLSFSIHEFAHAFVAYKLGDNTPVYQGRLTLNPFAHMDPMGMICLLFVGFGWGKPVEFDSSSLRKIKNKRIGVIFVVLAGVVANFILALFSSILVVVLQGLFVEMPLSVNVICEVFTYVYEFSLMLMAFNIIPIPPLDGFRFIEQVLPTKVRFSDGFRKFERNAPMIFMALIILGVFTNISVFSLLIGIIEYPAKLLIDSISYLVYSLF